MPQDRFFIDAPFALHKTLPLEDLEFHHLIHVMRVKENERIELVNGQGQLAEAAVLQIAKKHALLKIEAITSEEPGLPLILSQGLPRLNRLDFILEKGTELGLTDLWLFVGDLSEKKEVNLQRIKGVMIAAMKQCGRLFLPKVQFFPSIEKCPLQIPAYFGDLDPKAPLLTPLIKPGEPAAIFIGPEKGFSARETEWLKKKATGVKLNSHILRTDTAAIAAVAILAHLRQIN
jgi:16S rRNA (uracil1498-N3)-methyltransferase